MVIFIKKIKTKEGINSLNLDKVKKDIPSGYQLLSEEPAINFTANHIVVAYKCKSKENPTAVANKKPANKKVANKKKAVAAKG